MSPLPETLTGKNRICFAKSCYCLFKKKGFIGNNIVT